MKKNILLFIIVLASVNLNAQNSKEDSLVLLLNKSVDSSKVNILNELSRSLWYYQLNKATSYNLQAMSLADSIAYQPGIAEANRCRGVILSFKNDSSGMPYLIKAFNIFKALDNKKGIAATLNNQGSAYLKQGQFSKALDVLFQALKLFSELEDKEAVGAATNQVGNVYALLRDYAAALDYYSKALAIRRQIADKPGTAFSLNRIGDMYFKLGKLSEAITNYKESYDISLSVGRSQNIIDAASNIGNVYKLQGKYNEALSYFKTSLIEEEKFFGKDNIGFSYQHIGETYLALKNYNASLFNFQKALQIAYKKKSNDAAIILQQVGRVYFEQGDYIKALENCLHSLDLAKQTKNNEAVKETSLTLSQVYAAKGDFVNAYRYHQQYASAKDSILNENLNNKLASLEQSFEVKNRQTQIDLLNRDKELQQSEISRQKQQRYAFIAGIFLFAVLAVLLFRSNRHKQKTNLAIEKAYYKLEQAHETLKATQTQLIQSEKMASLGELTAGIAHEIQNPLNYVNNFSEVNTELLVEMKDELKKGNIDEANAIANDVIDNEQKINHHGKRADAIVKGMLQHSQASSGKKELTDINKLAEEYLRLSYHGLRAKNKTFNATLKTDFDPSIGNINIIPQDIGRVLVNLYNNAFYTVNEKKKQQPEGYEPIVSVSTKNINGKVETKIADNGNGIPQKIIDKIFQPFFTTKPTGQGTGLGLSLSYDIIKAHGGEIKVETKEGDGTVFIILLSLQKNDN